jgi:hypothetical protein
MDAALGGQPAAAFRPTDISGKRTLLDMLDRAFRIYRGQFVAFLALTAIVMLPTTIANIPVSIQNTRDPFNETLTTADAFSTLVALVAAAIQVLLTQPMLTYMASESYLGGKSTMGEAFAWVRSRVGKLFGAWLLFGASVMVAGIASGLLLLCYVGVVGFALLVYMAWAIGYCLLPVITLENVKPRTGLNRAWHLGKQRFWRGLGLNLLVGLVTLTFVMGLYLVVEFALLPLDDAGFLVVTTLVRVIALNLLQMLTLPLHTIAFTVFYYDTRVRLEGLDVAFYLSSSKQPRPASVPSPAPKRGFLTGRDVANVLVLILLFTALFALVYFAIVMPIANTIDAGASSAFILGKLDRLAQTEVTTITEEDYWQRLRAAANDLEGVIVADDDARAAVLEAVNERWDGVEAVRLASGEIVAVNMDWLRLPSNTGGGAVQTAHNRATALLAYHAAPGGGGGLSLAALEGLIEAEEAPTPSPRRSLELNPPPGFATVMRVVMIALGIMVVIGGLWGLAHTLRRTAVMQPAAFANGDGDEPQTADAAQYRADASAQAQDYRAAVRYLYLASLLLLDEKRLLRYDPTLTNREHLQRIQDKRELVTLLRPVISVFDRTWYGFADISEADYRQYLAHVERLRQLANERQAS